MIYIQELRSSIKEIKNNHIFKAIVSKESFRIENGKLIPTIMLKHVENEDGKILTDHLWQDKFPLFNNNKKGDVIKFKGKPIKYMKYNKTEDYNLEIIQLLR